MALEAWRRARAEDAEQLSVFVEATRSLAAAARGGELEDELGALTRPPLDLDDANQCILIGSFEGHDVGAARAYLRPGVTGSGIIDWCYVEPAARGVGVGEMLLSALCGELHHLGCHQVDALALPGDRDSKRLYEASGFKTRLLILHRQLD